MTDNSGTPIVEPSAGKKVVSWEPGVAPIAVVMISLNEGHNMAAVLENLQRWAQEVFLVDSYSRDETVDMALSHGVHVVQRRFRGFGDQWNYALRELPITAPWTMKLDPDERLTDQLKASIISNIIIGNQAGLSFVRRLWFMGKPLPIKQRIVRVWKTGFCRFTDVLVNEHPLVEGDIIHVNGVLEHLDSPNLHHWIEKQNKYTSVEAVSLFRGDKLGIEPRLFGGSLEIRMWFKQKFINIPFRYLITYMLNLIQARVWYSGRVGLDWARLRIWARRMKEDKLQEMKTTGIEIVLPEQDMAPPNAKAIQAD